MNGKDLSRQLSDLPEEMIAEAMAPAKDIKRKHFTVRLLRAAAIAAAVAILLTALAFWPASDEEYVTGPGVLVVTAYAADSEKPNGVIEVPLEEGVWIPDQAFLGMTNSYVGVPTHLSVNTEDFPSDKISYMISGTVGLYADDSRKGYTSDWFSTLNLENDNTFRYDLITGVSAAKQDWYDPKLDRTFTKIVIYCKGHIIGYAVIQYDRLYTDEWAELHPEMKPYYEDWEQSLPLDVFYCTLIKSVSFPKVDGRYQDVTQEYVDACMADVIEAHK